jgi:hypothetical protein
MPAGDLDPLSGKRRVDVTYFSVVSKADPERIRDNVNERYYHWSNGRIFYPPNDPAIYTPEPGDEITLEMDVTDEGDDTFAGVISDALILTLDLGTEDPAPDTFAGEILMGMTLQMDVTEDDEPDTFAGELSFCTNNLPAFDGAHWDPAQTVRRLMGGDVMHTNTGLGYGAAHSRFLYPFNSVGDNFIYIELRMDSINDAQIFGLVKEDHDLSTMTVGGGNDSPGVKVDAGRTYIDGVMGAPGSGPQFGSPALLMFAFRQETGDCYWGNDGTWFGGGKPGDLTATPLFTVDPSETWYFATSQGLWTLQATINEVAEVPADSICNLYPWVPTGTRQTWRMSTNSSHINSWSGRWIDKASTNGVPSISTSTTAITGKKYMEIWLARDFFGASTGFSIGVCNSTQPVNGTALGTTASQGIGMKPNGDINHGGVIATITPWTTSVEFGQVFPLCMWIDEPNAKVWFGEFGTSYSGDPVAGTGGFDISAIKAAGSLLIAVQLQEANIFGHEALIANAYYPPGGDFTVI